MRSYDSAMTARTPEQHRALGRPVARRAGAVLLAGQDDQRHAGGLVGTARRRRSSPARRSGRLRVKPPSTPGTSWLRSRMLANVPRIITSWLPRREPYELKSLRSTPCVGEVAAGRGVGLDRAGRRDVVGGDRVAELGQHPGAGDVGDRRRRGRHALEVRGLAHVGRVGVPGEGLAGRRRQRLPALVAGEHVGVVLGEHLRRDRRRR